MFTLPETITIWVEASDDGGGGKTWTRTTAKSRHALKVEQFRDAQGQLTVSKVIVYSKATELVVGAMVLIGESPLSAPTADSEEVRALSAVPGSTNMVRAML